MRTSGKDNVNIFLFSSSLKDAEFLRDQLSDSDRSGIVIRLGSETAPADDGLAKLIVRLDGDNAQVALWTQGKHYCPSCLELRSTALRHRRELSAHFQGSAQGPKSCQWLTEFACELIRTLILSLVADIETQEDFGYSVSLPTLQTARFQLEPHSKCPRCKNGVGLNGSLVFPPKLRTVTKSGGHVYRVAEPNQLKLPLARWINPVCGAFGSAQNDRREHEYCAQVTGSFQQETTRADRISWSGRASTYGQSQIVALLEASERHAGLKQRNANTATTDSFKGLGKSALDPRRCGLYEESLYARSQDLSPFSEEQVLKWVCGYSLTSGKDIWIPAQLVWYGEKCEADPIFAYENSNGCGVGACLEEAIFAALLELIERDSFLLHWYARISPPFINPGILTSVPEAMGLLERLRLHNFDVHLLDLRLDLAVPSVAAVACRRDNNLGAMAVGLGCSFDAAEAVLSAIREVTGRLAGFQQRTEKLKSRLDLALENLDLVRSIEDHGALYGLPEARMHAEFLLNRQREILRENPYRSWESLVPKTLDLLDDIQFCLSLFNAAGLRDAIVVDQTSPEQARAGLRCARVIVPGLLPMDFGNGRSRATRLERLYRVPVQLGLRKAFSVEDINRIPHPFA